MTRIDLVTTEYTQTDPNIVEELISTQDMTTPMLYTHFMMVSGRVAEAKHSSQLQEGQEKET